MVESYFDQGQVDEIAFAITDLLDEVDASVEEKRIALAQVISSH